MKLLKENVHQYPKISLILLDWSVRESFHLLHYLSKQDVQRDLFEVVIIEYYSRVSDAIQKFEDQVDTWMLLEMPESCYYHKHLMYNCGIVLSKGDICVICDSDAMVKEGFIRTILEEFQQDPRLVLHLDQFRNMRRDFYPFNYPSFDAVLGAGCINNVDGKTKGVVDIEDPIHTRNYGACMCARREDLIAIGGADEHIDYLGHICGPYDMTFRLANNGLREIWHQSEFMYHTWHPGQAGVDNYLGPHDGRHVSTTALEALTSKRTMPLLENGAIRMLRTGTANGRRELLEKAIRPEDFEYWSRENVEKGLVHRQFSAISVHVQNYKGFSIHNELGIYYAHLLIEPHQGIQEGGRYKIYFEGTALEDIRASIDKATPPAIGIWITGSRLYIMFWQVVSYLLTKLIRPAWARYIVSPFKRLLGLPLVLYAWLRRRLQQFALEKRLLADSVGDIIPNLYHFAKVRPDLAAAGTPILLVDSMRFEVYLKILAVARILPRVQIVRTTTTNQLRAFLAEYAAANAKRPLILARGVYVRYHTIISADELAKDAAVI